MGTSSRAVVSIVLVVAACGAAPRPTRRPEPSAPVARPIHVRTTVLGGAAIEIGAVEDGMHGSLAGGHRLRWSDPASNVEVADEVLGAGLAGAVHHADGWRFADRHGDLWSASTFLGPVTHAGTLGIRHFEIAPARGTIALLAKNRTRALLLSDGRGPARQACPFPVLAAAFVDAMHGLVVADGGGLFRTEDGGATWLPVAPSEGPFVWVDLDAEGLLAVGRTVDGLGAVSRVSTSGALSPIVVGSPASETRPGLDTQRSRGAMFALATADGFLSLPTTALIDGVAVTSLMPDRMRVELASHRVATLDALPQGCLVRAWGSRFLAVCDSDARVGDGRAFRPLANVPGQRAAMDHVASEDGRTVAWVERVGEDGARVRIVVLDADQHTRHERMVDAEQFRLLSVHETTVLIDHPGPTLRLLDASSGHERSIDVRGTMHGARISADGDVLVSAIEGNERGLRAVLLRGRFDQESLEPVPTPPDAVAAGLVDARHGIAVGETLDSIRTTRDGGASWQPLLVGTRDESPLLRLAVAESEHPLSCDASRCVVTPTRERPGVTVVFGGPPIGGPRVLRAASGDPPIEAVTPDAATASHLACEIEPVANERARALAPGAVATATATGTVVLRGRRGAGATLELSWSGRDASGTYRSRARGAPPTELADATAPSRARALWASRALVVVEVCNGQSCATVVGRAGGAVEPWTFGLSPLAQTDDGALLGVMATPDGAGLQVRSLRDGAATTLRRFILPDVSAYGLVPGPSPALIARTPSGRWRLYPFDVSAPPRAYPNVSADLPVCTGPAVPDAVTVRFLGGPLLEGVAPPTTLVELGRESVCIRSMEIWPLDALPVTFRGVLTASSGGLLEGRLVRREGAVGEQTVVRESGERGFRCRLAD